jgi:hypothetical protein
MIDVSSISWRMEPGDTSPTCVRNAGCPELDIRYPIQTSFRASWRYSFSLRLISLRLKRDPESRNFRDFWIPAFAGMTDLEHRDFVRNFWDRTLVHFELSYPERSGEVQSRLQAKAKLTQLHVIEYCTAAEQ